MSLPCCSSSAGCWGSYCEGSKPVLLWLKWVRELSYKCLLPHGRGMGASLYREVERHSMAVGQQSGWHSWQHVLFCHTAVASNAADTGRGSETVPKSGSTLC